MEVTGNLWTYPADWRVITTNGFVKKNGECVMGRGCAQEAAKKWPWLPKELGGRISSFGNNMYTFDEINLISFPVKHNWYEKADLDLIRRSVGELQFLLDPETPARVKGDVVIPRPGCGNGQLKWEDVRPLLTDLPDNVKVITHAL